MGATLKPVRRGFEIILKLATSLHVITTLLVHYQRITSASVEARR